MAPRRPKKSDESDIRAESSALLRKKSRGMGLVILIALVSVIVLVIAGAVYFQTNVVPFQRAVVTVDKTPISMGYLLNRTKASGGDIARTLEQLVDEQIVKTEAPRLGIQVAPADVDTALRQMAGRSTSNTTANETASISDAEFKKWYQGELERTGLSDAEYKEMAKTTLEAGTLQQYLADQIPAVQEQVHLNLIFVANYVEAVAAKKRIDGGESFAAVAGEVSLDTQTKANGGDLGWLPRGLSPYDNLIFSLAPKTVSDPQAVDPSNPANRYMLFMVSEKAQNRQIDAEVMSALKARALSNWLSAELPRHSITINYDFTSTENQAWIDWQLSKK